MEEQLISFETAKLAKEKGYNITNIFSYDETSGIMLPKDPTYPGWHCYALEGVCPAPTQSLLQKWLREKHNIHIEIEIASDEELNIIQPYVYQWDFYKNGNITIGREFYDSYEEALEVGLLEALKLI